MSTKEIWVIAEIRKGNLTRVTAELAALAQSLAEAKGMTAVAVLVGGDPSQAEALSRIAGRVCHLASPALSPYEANRQVAALASLAESRGAPHAILAPASASGQETMPRLAARLQGGYAASCTRVWWEGDLLAVKRPVYGGRVYEDLAFDALPALVTVRPGAFQTASPLPRPGAIETVRIDIPDSLGLKILEQTSTSSGKIELTEAARIVSGGRGMGKPEAFKLIEELAEALGAAVGASRALVDAGIRPYDEQVGKSGKTVSPELYVACGISGAIHHVLGMNTAKVVVAINKDPEALIFKSADYGLVGDAAEILPELTRAVRK